MKIHVRRTFRYMPDNDRTLTLAEGDYEVPRDVSQEVAALAISFGAAVIVPKRWAKRAPENKVVKVNKWA